MIEIDGFLEPVAGADPCGENLYYSPVFDKIREARRQDDAGPMGQWERELKASDFRTVIKLAEETLRTKTKDLWLAAWLTEAWINRDRIPGLLAGLKLITALMTTFWEGLHPDVEDADLGLRATPLEWLGSAATAPSPILLLKAIPLTESGVTWLVYKDARAMGYEDAVRGNDARTKARAAAIKEGKLSPEEFDKQFAATPKAFYRQLESDCGEAAAVLADLNRFCDERFGDDSPNFSPLRSALEDIATDVHSLLHKKLETDPDPVEAPP
ncbi:MAG TPA: type VI secretion system protein TssA, partial [Bryobacteraceae bacterium]|nr:type VI secretion system protein TssA [Bryobacteraceae bacterium]